MSFKCYIFVAFCRGWVFKPGLVSIEVSCGINSQWQTSAQVDACIGMLHMKCLPAVFCNYPRYMLPIYVVMLSCSQFYLPKGLFANLSHFSDVTCF